MTPKYIYSLHKKIISDHLFEYIVTSSNDCIESFEFFLLRFYQKLCTDYFFLSNYVYYHALMFWMIIIYEFSQAL